MYISSEDASKNQKADSIVERNTAASLIMQNQSVAIDDLFGAITPHLARLQNPNDVHFNGEGYEFLGKQVAAVLATQISK